MPYCVKCGTEIEDGVETCPECCSPVTKRFAVTSSTNDVPPVVFTGRNVLEVIKALFTRPLAVFSGLPLWQSFWPGLSLVVLKSLVYALAIAPKAKISMFGDVIMDMRAKVFFQVFIGNVLGCGLIWLSTYCVARYVFRAKVDEKGLANQIGLLTVYNLTALLAAALLRYVSMGLALGVVASVWSLVLLCYYAGLHFVVKIKENQQLWLAIFSQAIYMLGVGIAVQVAVRKTVQFLNYGVLQDWSKLLW